MSYKAVELVEIPLAEDTTVSDGQTAVTTPVDVSAYDKMTVYVKSDVEVTVRVKGGVNADNLASLKTGDLGGGSSNEDSDLSWNCSGELICFPIHAHLLVMQLTITNASGSEATVSAWVSGI